MKRVVDQFVLRHQLLLPEKTVLVAVSGGPDSMALLHYVMEKKEEMDLCVIALHAEHGLRGKESESDMSFVIERCRNYDIECVTEKLDVKAYVQEYGASVQEAARVCRYDFFERTMRAHDGDVLAMGHHGDDQIETMIMRQVRGAGAGLKGIPVKRTFAGGFLVRPFLNVSKENILAYCKEHRLPYQVDLSNEEDKYTRNRFRKRILPFFKEENPNVHERFQSQSEWLHEDEAFLTDLAKERLSDVILEQNEKQIRLSVKGFLDLPIPLQRRGFHLILNYLSIKDDHVPSLSVHKRAFMDLLVQEHPSGHLDLPGDLFVDRSYDHCLISTEAITADIDEDMLEKRLPVPGMVMLKKGMIKASVSPYKPDHRRGLWVLQCNLLDLCLPLTVRSRKPGDRVFPKGMTGSKKMKDIFIDKKVPRHLRDTWPIVTDAKDRIVWVPGLVHTVYGSATSNIGEVLYMECELDDDPFREVT
ncbi:tRNA lysidine(34) synthetase TilS [Alteribacter aurantiacus]|uniref:tRNA lysidine(34) synthetase TilS n=1 Tax=Alteribacter aurantiacus TaxID=254410 RepID=UPI0004077814|nr:tRNA lysidine(34) synthetase TilS [Alteribacter aurantiacus]